MASAVGPDVAPAVGPAMSHAVRPSVGPQVLRKEKRRRRLDTVFLCERSGRAESLLDSTGRDLPREHESTTHACVPASGL